MVEPPHRGPPRRGQRRRSAQGAALLRPLPGRRPSATSDVRRYRRYFPVPRGQGRRRVDTRLPHRLLDAGAHRPGRTRGAHPGPPARPARALPLRADAPAGDLAQRRSADRDIQGAFQRGLYAPQLRRVLAAFPAERCGSVSTRPAGPTPRAQLARTYEFLGLAPHELDADAFRGEVNPTTRAKFEPSAALRGVAARGLRRRHGPAGRAGAGAGPLALAQRARGRAGLTG